jgi:hypothetical protein
VNARWHYDLGRKLYRPETEEIGSWFVSDVAFLAHNHFPHYLYLKNGMGGDFLLLSSIKMNGIITSRKTKCVRAQCFTSCVYITKYFVHIIPWKRRITRFNSYVHQWQRCPAQHLSATSKTSVLHKHPPVWNAWVLVLYGWVIYLCWQTERKKPFFKTLRV